MFSSLSDYIITTFCFHLYVVISKLIQSKPALNQHCAALKSQDFRAKKSALNSSDSELTLSEKRCIFRSEERWFRESQSWSDLKQRWSALMFFMLSESELNSDEKCQISETALNIFWDFNPGDVLLYKTNISNSSIKQLYQLLFKH